MQNNFIKKKTVFITGSSSGIGFGLAKNFLHNGYEVIICSSNLNKLKKSSKALNDCFYVKADLTREKDIKLAIRKIKAKFKKIDVLVCNYGNSDFKKNNLDFNHSFNNNFFSTVYTVMNGVSILKKTGKSCKKE